MRVIFTILSLVLFAGCNSAKRVLKNQKDFQKVGEAWAKQNPCVNDSVTIIKPGRVDTLKLTAPLVDLKKAADSIAQALADKYNQKLEDCERQVTEAYNAGFTRSSAAWAKMQIRVSNPDTILTYVIDNRAERVLQNEKSDLQNEFISAQKDAGKWKGQRNTAYIIIGLLALISGVLSYFKFFK